LSRERNQRMTPMTDSHVSAQPRTPRVLIFSQRNIFGKALFRCAHYEFEDTICQVDSAEVLAPSVDPSNWHQQLARRVAYRAPVFLNPGIKRIELKAAYDVFLAVCGYPQDLLMVDAISNLREACTTLVCLVDELWLRQFQELRHFMRLLAKFDVVLLYYSQSVGALSERIGRKCVFVPPGVNCFAFCPYPQPPSRSVDVLSIGRRSETTHETLMRMAKEDGLFYLHDSVAGGQCLDSKQHRALFANVAKRSRYFIVNPGLIDAPEERGNQMEIGNRYFEGAASGTIMIGERPANEAFPRLFDWSDAMIHLPYGSGEIDAVIRALDNEPERRRRIRQANVVQSLMRHDWAYRWEAVLKSVGLEPLPALRERKERLAKLAQMASADGTGAAVDGKMSRALPEMAGGVAARAEQASKMGGSAG
jgi:hypothetical protein